MRCSCLASDTAVTSPFDLAREVMSLICHTAYRASVALAEEKGSFPYLDRNKYLEGPFIRRLPEDVRDGIAKGGIRNSHLIAIAPTGTISLLAGNVSSGLEPIFAASYRRKILDENGDPEELFLTDYAVQLWREMTGNRERRASRICDGERTAGSRPSRYAGGIAAVRGQFDFQDH